MNEKEVDIEKEQQLRQARQKEEMLNVLDEYFTRGVDKKKFIDTSRIPLICQDIKTIHEDIKEVKETQKEMQDNVKWGVRLILGAVVLAFISLLFK